MEYSSDAFHSDNEEEEQKSVVPSYEQVEALCLSQETGEFEREQLHLQAVARAAEAGQFDEEELKAV